MSFVPRGFLRDVLFGLAIALTATLALLVYALGPVNPHEHVCGALIAAALGVVISAMFKIAFTGKISSIGEMVRSAAITGFFSVAASTQNIWQAPHAWSDIGKLSAFGAALFCAFYHLANAWRLAAARKHLGLIGGFVALIAPFVCGMLLMLQSPMLVGNVGRVVLLVAFNEIVSNIFGLIARECPVVGRKLHLTLIACAVASGIAPNIADIGSRVIVPIGQPIVTVLATMLSQAGLWAEVFLITGMLLDLFRGVAPSEKSAGHAMSGSKQGAIYSGVFMSSVLGLHALTESSPALSSVKSHPAATFAIFGALLFPLAKTIIESFTGSQPFFRRLRYNYQHPVLFIRGIVVALAIECAVRRDLAHWDISHRVWFGVVCGAFAFAGVSVFRDTMRAVQKRGRVQRLRYYFVEVFFGAFIGAALCFYADAAQVKVIVDRFTAYTNIGASPLPFCFTALVSKWGAIQSGSYTGGAKLLFCQSLMGVITWGTAAWLFAINRAFLEAFFRRELWPIRRLGTRDGFADMIENTIHVMRWGLWMSPIIATFLWQMGEPTWFNQDGAIRSVFAIIHDATMSHEEFTNWSMKIFLWVLAYDAFRVLIWLDHMGLRVATLVNLSFLGMDRLDERIAKFIGRDATARFIPEGVKRFTTWAPLLIPYYIPAGRDWDYVWNKSQEIQSASHGIIETLRAFSHQQQFGLFIGLTIAVSAVSFTVRRSQRHKQKLHRIANQNYAVTLSDSGELNSVLTGKGYDLTRRSYEGRDPAGRALFIADSTASWPVIGNFPAELFPPATITKNDLELLVSQNANGIKTTARITLPDGETAAELWEITLTNESDSPRDLKVVPYLEWVLNLAGADRSHTQYNRLFPEMEFVAEANAVLALHRYTKRFGFVASDLPPQGFLTSRMDFIGRAGSIWKPRALETLAFKPPVDSPPCPAFDSIGSLLLGVQLAARETTTVRILVGFASKRDEALKTIQNVLKPVCAQKLAISAERAPLIGHGEIPPETPLPYFEFAERGKVLRVKTPFTPRPFDHTMSNALGHVMCVTNRGLHTTSSVNSQQNRLTTDWSDTVTRELPAEAFYLFDPDANAWFSPTFHPVNDRAANHTADFSVDGTATFHSAKDSLVMELVTFVPPHDPIGIYLLTVSNKSAAPRRLRFAPYFQIALADFPESAGRLEIDHDPDNAIFFWNPRNSFRSGPAFVAMSATADKIVTKRGEFFGAGRAVSRPVFVERGDIASKLPMIGKDGTANFQSLEKSDDAAVAAFLTTLEIPAGESCTVAVILGQADSRDHAEDVIAKFRTVEAARVALAETREWWHGLMLTLQVETNQPDFDGYLNWLKYQALAERVWARKGFYQASGAFGFRDQLQDTVNLIWVEPALARQQLALHAAQQFVEGDAPHWFFRMQDGRTGFLSRSHASDNLLWLGWGIGEYVRMTGDESLLDERASYLESETPLPPLPHGKDGQGFIPHRSTRDDSVFDHCLRAFDLVLKKRMGAHGLPLIGTGDWNDGLDEIGSEGRGESVWLGFFLHYILTQFLPLIEKRAPKRAAFYREAHANLASAIEKVWRDDRYLRAIHDDGTEIGVKGSGIWEIDALTAAWAVMSGINPERGRIIFETAIRELERENVILLGTPPLNEKAKPFLGRSCRYPAGVRENGMYCHGVQWLVRAARILAEQCARSGDEAGAEKYRATAFRLWRKISPLAHTSPDEIEIYGGQPNKQAADILTTFDQGRMIWNGYTGAAGWMLRQAIESVLGFELLANRPRAPEDIAKLRGDLLFIKLHRDISESPIAGHKSSPRKRWLSIVLATAAAAGLFVLHSGEKTPVKFEVPYMQANHNHARELLENALKYIEAPGMVDPASGYICEGLNNGSNGGAQLRTFTQLTGIGEWVELQADIAAGQLVVPSVSKDRAFESLDRISQSLLSDQADPGIAARGLLANFIGFDKDRRLGPLASVANERDLIDALGEARGRAAWAALVEKKWITPHDKGGDVGDVQRIGGYGLGGFNGPLQPFADPATMSAIMKVLDRRVAQIIFGDNANLSASLAKAVGALLSPAVAEDRRARIIRDELEKFLDRQRPGYDHLFDREAGQFCFGWNGTDNAFVGWNQDGKWKKAHMEYLATEFRGPLIFVTSRYSFPQSAITSQFFRAKSYRFADGRVANMPAPWDGSAFQMFGLSTFMQEERDPTWRTFLTNAVAVEIDFSKRHGLPGFLSESYTGNGTEYTGRCGIPDIAATDDSRLIDAPSLYSLGAAYQIAPAAMENFFAANWEAISGLFTDHGCWEGYNVTRREPVLFQTTSHTLALILGLTGTAPGNARRYFEFKQISPALPRLDDGMTPK